MDPWRNFRGKLWREKIDLSDFIRHNYQPFTAEPTFLCPPSPRTKRLWEKCQQLMAKERAAGGVLEIDVERVAEVTAWEPGYIDRDNEVIVGLQTDKPLKRLVNPWGGWRMVEAACKARNIDPDPIMKKIFTTYRRTQNEAIFRIYTPAMRQARHLGSLPACPMPTDGGA